jgi:hypothetical protein
VVSTEDISKIIISTEGSKGRRGIMWVKIKQIMLCFVLLFGCVPTVWATPLDDLFLLDSPVKLPTTPIINRQMGTAYVAAVSTPVAQQQSAITPSQQVGGMVSQAYNRSTLNDTVEVDALLQITRTPELLNALRRMNDVPVAKQSLLRLQQRGGRVLFKNLAELGPQYSTFDALAWLGKDASIPTGVTWILFIAEKHRKAPPEALASLITHEALHADYQNSYCEEEHAWLAEVTAWQAFKALNPALHHIPTGWFALVDRLNTIDNALAQQTLKTMIRTNPGYVGLAENSPYFRYSPFGVPRAEQLSKPVAVNPVSVGVSAVNSNTRAINKQPTTGYTTVMVANNGRPKLVLRPLKTWYH